MFEGGEEREKSFLRCFCCKYFLSCKNRYYIFSLMHFCVNDGNIIPLSSPFHVIAMEISSQFNTFFTIFLFPWMWWPSWWELRWNWDVTHSRQNREGFQLGWFIKNCFRLNKSLTKPFQLESFEARFSAIRDRLTYASLHVHIPINIFFGK